MAREVIIPYVPRAAFREYHASKKRFALGVCHRRAGKTVARVNRLIRSAVSIQRTYPNGRFAYLAPYRNQAKKIAWQYLKHYAHPLIKAGGKINESDLVITMPHNGATIELYGADNPEAMRGNYFDGIAPDEAQGIPRSTLTQIILPCLADYQGWLDCSGTPRGWSNLLGELVKLARQNTDDWYLQILKASQSGIIPKEELDRQRSLMSEDEYRQEFECDFDAAIAGAFYGIELRKLDEARHICAVPYDAELPVHTAWDLGYRDDTAIWWYQVIRGEIHVLESYAVSGAEIRDLAKVVTSKPYKYGKHFLPHDARAKTLAAQGRSIIEQLASHLGIQSLEIVPDLSVQDGIQAVRLALPRCWFDRDKCEMGLEALRQYQREWDEDKQSFREKPRHDWTSHYADAFRMLAIAWRQEPALKVVEPTRPLIVGPQNEATLNDMWAAAQSNKGWRARI